MKSIQNPTEKIFFLKSPTGNLAAVLHEANSDKIVIFAHGFTGSKHESGRLFVMAARSLSSAGFNVLRFDFMGEGDSSGDFNQMTPNTRITDLTAALSWAKRRKFARIGLLGLSLGGATAICTAAQSPGVSALVTWSTVPSYKFWSPSPEGKITNDPTSPALSFYTDRPSVDVPEAYCSLAIPKLQIQGDEDLPGFRTEFARYFPQAKPPKKHLIIPGADHVFSKWPHRRKAILETAKWFKKHL